MSATTKRDREWYTTPSGDDCAWCFGSDYEPGDDDDAEQTLCRGHLAEYDGGLSLDELDRMDAEQTAEWLDHTS